MPTGRASFESPEYWDARFTRSPDSFDWLVPPEILLQPLLSAMSRYTYDSPLRVLHIGCGTSGLSNLLRSHIASSCILNVDFSHCAIELGIQREQLEFGGTKRSMKWAKADLLDWRSIKHACEHACELGNGYSMRPRGDYEFDTGNSKPSEISPGHEPHISIVIEKSCADAIACGVDIPIPLPYILGPQIATPLKEMAAREVAELDIHPEALLSLHLAAVTKCGGIWVAFSYSETRFDCLYETEDEDENFHQAKKDGLVPNPALLWKVEVKQEIIAQQEGFKNGAYRPKVSHWLYVLRRTELN